MTFIPGKRFEPFCRGAFTDTPVRPRNFVARFFVDAARLFVLKITPMKFCSINKVHLLAALLCLMASPGFGQDLDFQVDEGLASRPWSGSWFPLEDGGMQPHLKKYDAWLASEGKASAAAVWEFDEKVNKPRDNWEGYCHAWAAASLAEKEPQLPVKRGNSEFGVGDQKCYLTALHAMDFADSFGTRFGSQDAPKADLAPVEFWKLLNRYVQTAKVPLIVDVDCTEAVWNYPIFQYRVLYYKNEQLGGHWYDAEMECVGADDSVPANHVGTRNKLWNYSFKFQIVNGSIVQDSGEWTYGSVDDHPDFAWYPTLAVGENPDIDADTVEKIVGYPVGNVAVVPEGSPADESAEPVAEEVKPETVDPGPRVNTDNMFSATDMISFVLNKSSDFNVDVDTQAAFGGRYTSGKQVGISVRSLQAGYLYLFDVHVESGEVRLVFPHGSEDNAIKANELRRFGNENEQGSSFLLEAVKSGNHDLKAIVTSSQLILTGFPESAVRSPNTTRQPLKLASPASELHHVESGIRDGLTRNNETEPHKKLKRFGQDVARYFVFPEKQ